MIILSIFLRYLQSGVVVINVVVVVVVVVVVFVVVVVLVVVFAVVLTSVPKQAFPIYPVAQKQVPLVVQIPLL